MDNDKRKYARDYYRKRYNTDAEFREAKKIYIKSKYVYTTMKCTKCFARYKMDFLDTINYEYNKNEPNTFVCPNCLPENAVPQIKSRGRPKKVVVSDINTIYGN